ncbi:MAG: phosphate/phosphite/phosphonate ABC transporter substrate-binding protein, partial [Gammaproteobacteria bacterium]|nr:phosphate/phosphite/phosphonate ABC transporter substrate-binding protein [Gammaproteobacteria bacterium]
AIFRSTCCSGIQNKSPDFAMLIKYRFSVLLRYSLLVAMTIGLLYGCNWRDKEENIVPNVLRVAVMPDVQEADLRQRYIPLLEYLTNQIGIPFELITPDSYGRLLTLFRERKTDISLLGGHQFVESYYRDNAVPLVIRDEDLQASSYILVSGSSKVKSVRGLKGESFSFGDKVSTCGNLVPRYYFKDMDIVPEEFFSRIEYTAGHDEAAYRVRDGKVFAAVASGIVIDQMYKEGSLLRSQVRVLWATPPYPDEVWVVQPNIDRNLQQKLRSAFLGLSMTEPVQAEILMRLNTVGYMPVNIRDFKKLSDMAIMLKWKTEDARE